MRDSLAIFVLFFGFFSFLSTAAHASSDICQVATPGKEFKTIALFQVEGARISDDSPLSTTVTTADGVIVIEFNRNASFGSDGQGHYVLNPELGRNISAKISSLVGSKQVPRQVIVMQMPTGGASYLYDSRGGTVTIECHTKLN